MLKWVIAGAEVINSEINDMKFVQAQRGFRLLLRANGLRGTQSLRAAI